MVGLGTLSSVSACLMRAGSVSQLTVLSSMADAALLVNVIRADILISVTDDVAAFLTDLDGFITAEIVPLQDKDDNARFFGANGCPARSTLTGDVIKCASRGRGRRDGPRDGFAWVCRQRAQVGAAGP